MYKCHWKSFEVKVVTWCPQITFTDQFAKYPFSLHPLSNFIFKSWKWKYQFLDPINIETVSWNKHLESTAKFLTVRILLHAYNSLVRQNECVHFICCGWNYYFKDITCSNQSVDAHLRRNHNWENQLATGVTMVS